MGCSCARSFTPAFLLAVHSGVLSLHFPLLKSWGPYIDPHIGKISFSDLGNGGVASAQTLRMCVGGGAWGGDLACSCCHLSCWCLLLTKEPSTGTLNWLLTTLVMAVPIPKWRKDRFREVRLLAQGCTAVTGYTPDSCSPDFCS